MILTIRTDKPESELGLYTESGEQLQYVKWEAHRQLGETIFSRIAELLKQESVRFCDLTGVVFYEGPGSFTGLRIGVSVANVLIFGLGIKGVQCGGEDWIKEGVEKLDMASTTVLLPIYGSDPHITAPRK